MTLMTLVGHKPVHKMKHVYVFLVRGTLMHQLLTAKSSSGLKVVWCTER